MIESFLSYLSFERRFSSHTIEAYRRDLTQFSEFQQISSPDRSFQAEKIGHSDLRAWIINLVEQGLAPTSINRKIASVKSFFKYLKKQGIISKDPSYRLQALKPPKRLPVVVQEKEMEKIFSEELFSSDFEGLRDRIMLELLYATGIRLSELLQLKEADVNLHAQEIKVLGKRNKERIVPIYKKLTILIKDYLNIKKSLHLQNEGNLLLVKLKGEACYPMMVYRTINSFLTRYSDAKKKSPHVLRHTFATHLLNNGADLNAVKDLLGHSSLAATQVYTHNTLDKLKKVFDQAHPKA